MELFLIRSGDNYIVQLDLTRELVSSIRHCVSLRDKSETAGNRSCEVPTPLASLSHFICAAMQTVILT
jgi:hypothetical protein